MRALKDKQLKQRYKSVGSNFDMSRFMQPVGADNIKTIRSQWSTTISEIALKYNLTTSTTI